MLVEDVLLKIFSFLTVYEKLVAARVCRRWNTLMTESQLWRAIDFHIERPPSRQGTRKNFLAHMWYNEERFTVGALKTYALFLKRVHLYTVTVDVLQVVTNDCQNLQTLSILPSGQNSNIAAPESWYLSKRGGENCKYIISPSFTLPTTLRKLQLSFNTIDPKLVEDPFRCYKMTQSVLDNIVNCENLHHLMLMECVQLRMIIVTLTKSLPNLRELWLLKFTTDPCDNSNTAFQGILRQTAKHLQRLTSLRFIPLFRQIAYSPAVIIGPPIYSINDHLCKDLGQLRNLRDFGIGDIRFTEESFIILIDALPHLEELTLRNCDCVTDRILAIIVKDLICLKMLDLTGSRPESENGFLELHHHPSLRIIRFYRPSDLPFQYYAGIFETLGSLSKLEHVEGLGDIELSDTDLITFIEQLQRIKPNVKWDVKIEKWIRLGLIEMVYGDFE